MKKKRGKRDTIYIYYTYKSIYFLFTIQIFYTIDFTTS